jgi:hypothetical protein
MRRLRFEVVSIEDLIVGDVPHGVLDGNFDWYSETPDGAQLHYKCVMSVTQNFDVQDGGFILPAYDVVVSPYLNGAEVDDRDRRTFHARALTPVTIVVGNLASLWNDTYDHS